MDPAQPQLGSRAAGAGPGRAGGCAGPRGAGPSPLFHVRPLQQPLAQRDLGLRCRSLKERMRLFEADVPASQSPGPRARGMGGQEPRPSGRAPSSRGPALSPSSARPPAQREGAERLGEAQPPSGVGPGCSVREQVRTFELRFGAGQAPGAAAAPWGRGGQTGAPAAAGSQQSRAAWSRELEPRPPEKGGRLSALSAGLCLPQLEPPAPEQSQRGGEGSSRALDMGALRAGARARGLPQAPADTCSPRLGQAGRPQAAQGEGTGGKGPFRGPLLSHGPLMSSPLPADSRAPEPPPALPPTPWGLGEPDRVDSDSAEPSLSAPSERRQPVGRNVALSLAELSEFGRDRKEAPPDEGGSASLSCSRSMASPVPAHGLEQLLEESLQVRHAFASGLAAQGGTIQPGGEVLSINGPSLTGCSHGKALPALHRARQALEVLPKGAANRVAEGPLPAPRPGPPPPAPDKPATVMSVQLVKDAHGLGFSLAGGRRSLQGDRPLTVKKIFLGGPAERLQPGDELLQIQDKRLQGLARLEAWNLIRALPTGPVRLLVRKRGKP